MLPSAWPPGGRCRPGWCRSPDVRSRRCRHLLGGPGIERVVYERGTFQQPLVVVLDVKTAQADREQARTERIGVEVMIDVGGVHDGGEAHQRPIAAEVEVVDQHLERAFPSTVVELGTRSVEAAGVVV